MTIIAEIGTSHEGSLKKAKSLIDGAAQAGADCVKFQWVYADEILHPKTGTVKLPTGNISLYQRFKSLELNQSFFADCLDYAHKKNLLFACSPFGLKSLEELCQIKPDAIKIASPEVNHIPLLKAASSYYKKIPIIISSGVSTLSDIEKAVETITQGKDQNALSIPRQNPFAPLTLLHCITSYPAPEEEYNVRCVKTLSKVFGIPTGISDHSLTPVLVPCLTAAMGGSVIEKHITLSRKTDGLDDPVALELEQFAQMVQAVHQTEAIINRYKKECLALTEKNTLPKDVPQNALNEIIRQLKNSYPGEQIEAVLGSGIKRLAPSEKANYGRTNRSLHYLSDLKKGHRIEQSDIAVLRTEKILTPGISPLFIDEILGSVLTRDVHDGDGVLLEDFLTR